MRTSTAGNKGKLFSFSSSSLFSLSLSSPHRKMKNAIPLRRRIFPGQRNTPSRIRGFTLLELIVVISVMLLVLGLAVTSFRGESPARLLERSTLEFESFCAAVRYQAMEKGEDRIVVFVPETRVFRMRIPAPSADDEDGNGAYGEIFFPKLGEEKMMTFSAICDRFLSALGYEKKECATDEEAKKFAAEMPEDSKVYPVVYFRSDTTGEKDFEEFYVPGEKLNMDRFASLGVIEDVKKRPMEELETFFHELETIFHEPDFTKAEVVEAIKRFLPNFEHVEKGKNLDQKM